MRLGQLTRRLLQAKLFSGQMKHECFLLDPW
jgi:hypothetical protein